MRSITIILLSLVIIASAGCSSGEGYSRQGYDFSTVDTVAVISVEGRIAGAAAKNQISDYFIAELLQKGYAPVERAEVEKLLEEHEFQASGLTSNTNAAQAGRILNVPAVIIVNIPEFKDNIAISAKMVDVEDGSILWLATGEGKVGEFLTTLGGAAAGAAAGIAVSGEDDEAVGGIAGGVLGGVVANQMTPQKEKKAKEIIDKMCESLPSLMTKPEKKGWF
ncbi:Curli production assembly/transport component CsgG [Anaerohalosphaera lusitana]|uniref:Curli production assembly/transport component CsgG n=1 Tax=Anaerohalosphaera lusitana TaxID=1936003 RepID=A0A1U9NPP1_9BACT|nr:CsgG/HfaB family protein [Anaerohalosphaera lusitana]AQT69902.1 Curli production assembly/transport component CsgG [Anaerohalosphaera lusitana]